MEKSAEQIAAEIYKKIFMQILTELPVQSCPLKKAKREWKIEVINQLLIDKLNDKSGAK
jgi:hypothetical protein